VSTPTITPTVSRGTSGALYCGALRVGVLTAWEVVISPTTQQPTLKGEGHITRWATLARPATLTARLTPARPPVRLGRPRPKAPTPFALTGRVARLTARYITLAEGEITL
jgi:hypothetical protein